MSDYVPPSLAEVWTWKKQDEEATRHMNHDQLIEYYKSAADALEQKLGLRLNAAPAAAARGQTPSTPG